MLLLLQFSSTMVPFHVGGGSKFGSYKFRHARQSRRRSRRPSGFWRNGCRRPRAGAICHALDETRASPCRRAPSYVFSQAPEAEDAPCDSPMLAARTRRTVSARGVAAVSPRGGGGYGFRQSWGRTNGLNHAAYHEIRCI